MEFMCERCGYQVKQRCALFRHLHKQKPCPAYMSDIDRQHLIDKLVQCAKPLSVDMSHSNLAARDFSRDENIEYVLTNHDLVIKCIKKKDIARIIREVNFNPMHPENHNIRAKEGTRTMEYIEGGVAHECDCEYGAKYILYTAWRVLDKYQNDNRGRLRSTLSGPEWYECKKWIDNLTDEDENPQYNMLLEMIWELTVSVTSTPHNR
jgi:hypothetical protein